MGTAIPTQRWSSPDLGAFVADDDLVDSWTRRTGKLPGAYYLGVAGAATALSIGLKIAGRGKLATFVAQFVGPVLLIGLYDMLMTQRAPQRA